MDLARVSACTYPLIDRSAPEAMRIIAAAGFRKIDLLGRLPHLSLDLGECDPAAVQRAADACGLRIANLGTYVGRGLAAGDPATQEGELRSLCRAIDLAVFFGARSIRVAAGNDEPACIDRIVPWFRRGAEYAAARGIYMGVENHGGGISGRPELCAELAAAVGSPYFGVLYEPYNLMAAGTDYRAALETMKEHIVHTHFKDGKATAEGFQLTMMGEGEIDFAWIVERLNGLGYRGDFAFEYELKSEPPETGLAKWYQAAKRL